MRAFLLTPYLLAIASGVSPFLILCVVCANDALASSKQAHKALVRKLKTSSSGARDYGCPNRQQSLTTPEKIPGQGDFSQPRSASHPICSTHELGLPRVRQGSIATVIVRCFVKSARRREVVVYDAMRGGDLDSQEGERSCQEGFLGALHYRFG